MTKVTCEQVIQVLVENLEPLEYPHALWVGGADGGGGINLVM